MVVQKGILKLDKGEKLGEGGQAIVYKIDNTTAAKIYKNRQEVDTEALYEMVRFQNSLSGRERSRLENETSWPREIIQENELTVGVLMPLAPMEYFVRRSPNSKEQVLLTFNNLLMPILPAQKVFVPEVSANDRIKILQNFLSLSSWLHERMYILGDISGKNIAWSPTTKRTFLMDCDSARRVGKSSALPQMHTIQFEDPTPMPHLEHQSSLDTDNFRIGLIVVGVLTQNFPLTPGKILPKLAQRELDKVADTVGKSELKLAVRQLWTQLGLGAGLRPNSEEWATALT